MMPMNAVSVTGDVFLGAEGSLGPLDVDLTNLVDEWVASRPGGQERLIPLLHRVQHELGYLPPAAQMLVADRLQLSPVQVAGVVSFYHFFTTVPRGRFQLKVCMGTACFVRGGSLLISAIQDTLGIGLGEVTEDRLFSFEQVRCIGACGLAPAMMVNDDVYGHLDATGVRKLVRKLRSRARKEEVANA